jgi:hypothetical protein
VADPTLNTDATYTGLTVNQMLEEVLRRRGLTLDSDSTGRVVATAAEQADILLYLKRAHNLFNSEYQDSFAVERSSGTWTSGDTAIMAPANCQMVLSIYFNGRFVYPMEMEDLRRGTRFNEDATSNMGFAFEQQGTLFWRISGVADADAVANGGGGTGVPDYRPVIQIYGSSDDNPLAAEPYVIDYVRFGTAFVAGTNPGRVPPVVQEWTILRATELWASAENDQVASALAKAERAEIMPAIWAAFDARGDTAQKARWTYPNDLSTRSRRSTS